MRTNFTTDNQMRRLLSIFIGLMTCSAINATDPTVTSVSPANETSDARLITSVKVTFSTAMNPFTINPSTFVLRGPDNSVIPATISYNAASRQATLTPFATLVNSVTYRAAVMGGGKGVKDLFGNKMKNDYAWSFKKKGDGPDNTAPEVKLTEPENGGTGVSLNSSIVVKFTEDMDPTTITAATFQLFDGANQLIPATVSYHEPPRKATLTPHSPLANSTVYTARIAGGVAGVKDLAGNPMTHDYTWTFSTPFNIFGPLDAPVNPLIIDQPVEVGVKFTTTTNGKILGLRFYKGAGNDGIHTGHLWNNTGTLLTQATFINETASGWQQVLFATPISINAGQVYVASYFSSLGKYGFTNGYFVNSVVNGPIRALANGESGGNGVYAYSASGTFPVNSFNATNYFVDVVFVPHSDNDRLNLNNNNSNNTTTITQVVNAAEQRNKATGEEVFEVKAIPNPGVDNFNLHFKSSDANPVSVRITDVSGQLVEMRERINATGILRVGQNWKTGIYFAEVMQGDQRKVIKLIKTN